jgi:multidrug efflux system outer membrane protein
MDTLRSMLSIPIRSILVVALILALPTASCAVGPDYEKPDVADITPPEWRWKPAEPSDAAEKGEWWKLAHDPALDDLEARAVAHNQDLRAAVARVDEARAVARVSKSEFFPQISLDPSFTRERTSGNLPTPIPVHIPAAYVNSYSVPIDLSYEVDLWGRVRRSFEASTAQAEATVSDYQNVLLTLTSDVATNYFQVRSLDTEIAMLHRTVELRDDELRVASARFAAGSVPEIDVAQAKLELASAQVDLANAERQREEAFNALALLCGKPPAAFELTESAVSSAPMPERAASSAPMLVPPGLPSSLLERRPDVATAERNLAASNARIGVAKSAYFPVLRLTGQAGFLSNDAESLFNADSKVWSITPSLSLPLFTGGRTAAEVEQAKALHEEALAHYREVVLRAFKEVEDALADIALREREAKAQEGALESARRVTELAKARYEAGNSPYLEFIDAERTQLYQERLKIQLEYKRQAAGIGLVKALGGSFETD